MIESIFPKLKQKMAEADAAQAAPSVKTDEGDTGAGEVMPAEPEAGTTGEDVSAETRFPEVTKKMEETPHKAFDDPDYYKKALGGGGEKAQRLHAFLQKYLKTADPKEKGTLRQNIITAYWEFLATAAGTAAVDMPPAKKFLLRFAVLHPGLIDQEKRTFLSRIIVDNTLKQPVYYLDEWFKAIGSGELPPSTTDEIKIAEKNAQERLKEFFDKAKGKAGSARNLIRSKNEERRVLEKKATELIASTAARVPIIEAPDLFGCYNDSQKAAINQILEILHSLLKLDHALGFDISEFRQADEELKALSSKIEIAGSNPATADAINTEFGTVRQMAKMVIGRQGNHFPVLVNEYLHGAFDDIASRESVIEILSWIESIDPQAFCRIHRNKLNRIAPYVLLLPVYGDSGVCWEPFSRYNRLTSRARLAIPMYSKNLREAVLYAVGDLRWQTAKEKASYYWMEEGITGDYFQWFQKMKLKGDLKDAFIRDYILWITKESEGVQRLDKEIRNSFWRKMPFSQELKEKLKTRNFVYQELYQRDQNRAMSVGY